MEVVIHSMCFPPPPPPFSVSIVEETQFYNLAAQIEEDILFFNSYTYTLKE